MTFLEEMQCSDEKFCYIASRLESAGLRAAMGTSCKIASYGAYICAATDEWRAAKDDILQAELDRITDGSCNTEGCDLLSYLFRDAFQQDVLEEEVRSVLSASSELCERLSDLHHDKAIESIEGALEGILEDFGEGISEYIEFLSKILSFFPPTCILGILQESHSDYMYAFDTFAAYDEDSDPSHSNPVLIYADGIDRAEELLADSFGILDPVDYAKEHGYWEEILRDNPGSSEEDLFECAVKGADMRSVDGSDCWLHGGWKIVRVLL